MFLDNLLPDCMGILTAPSAILKRLCRKEMVSFGLLANLNVMKRRKTISGIDSIWDIGANQGQFAFMAHCVWPELPIYSFEPDPDSFVQLQQNFAKYAIPGQPHNVALGAEQASLELRRYANPVNNSFLTRTEHNETESYTKVIVDCTTLDTFSTTLPRTKAALLKLDVQGFELAVIKGSTNFFRHCRYVLAEVSFSSSYTNGAHADEVMLALREHGFECIQLLDLLRDKQTGHILEADMLFVNKRMDGHL
ncbi:FkbM family methyltransferase [Methylophilus aquaticus]|uniref:FkbM family methyltransferase n=1 Tax=Methylophilus aquaticus TaxID=1971610 RepID=A0ABT9JU25_9PROT|nr:FkbM family methyltransferase [Methylophilus aquaticus]MDP8568093.1 FkbM family methyltransferase [Methylophilus aquaticus]